MKDELTQVVLEVQAAERNRGGHALMYARGNPAQQAWMEFDIAEGWAAAVNNKYDYGIISVSKNPNSNEVPDCFAIVRRSSVELSIELTEFVDEDLLNEINKRTELNSSGGKAFFKAQWNKERFLSKLTDRIDKKRTKYKRNHNVINVLIIHTDEPWLSQQQVESWLPELQVQADQTIQSAYFYMAYSPAHEGEAVYKLF